MFHAAHTLLKRALKASSQYPLDSVSRCDATENYSYVSKAYCNQSTPCRVAMRRDAARRLPHHGKTLE